MNVNAIAMKHILWAKIKKFGEQWGEEPAFVTEYAKEVYTENRNHLAKAIQCFNDLIASFERLPRRVRDAAKANAKVVGGV